MLGDRYRIVALIGRGGMGEVYRGEDLKLGQPVALKFLSEDVAHDVIRLAMFHEEVRVARQVSHPNVCRVYDIGELDGQHFLSMEYVDGEDLATLLRRIGRLPAAKATEIGHQLCAGLGAAHERGVLHRDLKPANVLIDGRGRARIADFGLAGFAEDRQQSGIIAGTPGYMAPEQFVGKGTSIKSDIYALGLVLYELFTGTRAMGPDGVAPRDSVVTRPSAIVPDIDAGVERTIMRCLEADPARRPPSALSVASALPGGDPLVAALAAGETPSPAMVAAAEVDGLSLRAIALCVTAIAIGLAAAGVIGEWTDPLRQAGSELPPAVLEQRARDVLASLGFTERPEDSSYDLFYTTGAPQVGPAPIHFWYRQSPRAFVAGGLGYLSYETPPQTVAGMVRLRMDLQGRLVQLDAVPTAGRPAADTRIAAWDALWSASGLDRSGFAPAEPDDVPLVPFDSRAAWTSNVPDASGSSLRVDAASWRGEPVHFQVSVVRPPVAAPAPAPEDGGLPSQVMLRTLQFVMVAVVAFAVYLAWRTLRQGRGDSTGGARIAIFTLVCVGIQWACAMRFVPTASFFDSFTWTISNGLFFAAMHWVIYMALEPQVRRRWPHGLISWQRLLSGAIRDPLVGGHLLIGIAFGMASGVMFKVGDLLGGLQGVVSLQTVSGAEGMFGDIASSLVFSISLGLGALFLIVLLRALLRRGVVVAIAYTLFASGSALVSYSSENQAIAWIVWLVVNSFAPLQLIRFGLLPMMVSVFVSAIIAAFPLTFDLSTWYARSTIVAFLTIIALTVFALVTALGGRRLFKSDLLESA
jgi:hypothetical protein